MYDQQYPKYTIVYERYRPSPYIIVQHLGIQSSAGYMDKITSTELFSFSSIDEAFSKMSELTSEPVIVAKSSERMDIKGK